MGLISFVNFLGSMMRSLKAIVLRSAVVTLG